MSAQKWKVGDKFFHTENPTKIWRVRRMHGKTMFYLWDCLGEYAPKGMIRKASYQQTNAFIKCS